MLAVIGATGTTGAGVVTTLLAAGTPVRAIVRDAAAARTALPPGAEIVTVDLRDRGSVDAALQGVDRLYCGLGRSPTLVADEQAVIAAAERAGVRQYVKCSGVTVAGGRSRIQEQHHALEEYLRGRVPYTIVAPSFFMQNFLGLAGAIAAGVLPVPTGAARAGLIDAGDIVRSVVAVLGDDRHLGQRYQLTGPASLSHADAAAIFARVLGHPVVHADVTAAEFAAAAAGAGLPGWFAELLADVYAVFFASGEADLVTDTVRTLTGTAPRSLEAWVRDHARAFAAPTG